MRVCEREREFVCVGERERECVRVKRRASVRVSERVREDVCCVCVYMDSKTKS